MAETARIEHLQEIKVMGYYVTSDNTRVYFQNGMDNHAPVAKASSALLAGLLKESVGAIINDSHGITGDVREYLPDTFSAKDILNEYTYHTLNAKGNPTLIVMHSAGNEDAYKALKAGKVYGYTYPNLSFLSVGSPVGAEKLQSVMRQSGSILLGQVNDWRDPVTNSKTAGTLALGLIGVGIVTGAEAAAPIGVPGGLLGVFAAGGIGGVAGGAVGFGSILYGLTGYHPFAQYFQSQKLQQQALNWQRQQSSDLKK
ncbi:hypothetical protein [Herbaspirillum chlorophenolicum]|uniref:hypothetical protein n=2 Tax=Herbaspirillum chlorophenolicum TaxID=211589 RepID=UPI0012E1DF07|nr:hypothetical protein [Herbaspirillum chlorophenolicum]